ncbi:hypothetical protein [Gordonia neofelifaecis]|nr:hypothetical protein [Gordonia neofelifaecis]
MSSESPSGRGRTVLLSLVVIVAVIILAAVGFMVFRSGPADTAAPGSTSTPSAATTTSDTETSSPAPTTPTRTTTTVPPGSVTYQLTGDGDVVALAYRDSGGRVVIAATGTPWSSQTTVSDRDVEMTAIVVRGPVTCTILQGDQLVSSSTAHGGPLRCAGRLPH